MNTLERKVEALERINLELERDIKSKSVTSAKWARAEALYVQSEADRKQWMGIAMAAEKQRDTLLKAALGLLADPYLHDPINNDRMAATRAAVKLIYKE